MSQEKELSRPEVYARLAGRVKRFSRYARWWRIFFLFSMVLFLVNLWFGVWQSALGFLFVTIAFFALLNQHNQYKLLLKRLPLPDEEKP